MDAKKLTGVLMGTVVAVTMIASAPPTLLALIEVALIGALYVIRRRRLARA
ncbi:MAG TPA: hypothetical protein VG994_14315 [Steroidobacteraceae bacterium]|nr:hypothetical protein [Steroidobacteraceae bacterium]